MTALVLGPLVFGCDDCIQLRTNASTQSIKILLVGALVLVAGATFWALRRAKNASSSRRLGWLAVALGLIALPLAAVPLVSEVQVSSPSGRIYCDKPIMMSQNPVFSEPDGDGGTAVSSAKQACREGFAHRRTAAVVF